MHVINFRSPAKTKRSKPFMFGSAKKDKSRDKSVEKSLEQSAHQSHHHQGEDKDDAEKHEKHPKKKGKLKLKSGSKHKLELHDKKDSEEVHLESLPIFGVPLEVATERSRSHDGIPLPAIVRVCIDRIEAEGLMQEGIYRSSGVKSKITKLRNAFNSKSASNVNLEDYEVSVVASVLKQFLRELPHPVLTDKLMPDFESVSANPTPQKRIEGMKTLIKRLPDCNRTLLQWIFVHMSHVIERERFNKMTLQNVSIVLSPTMKISHRVLNCFFENRHILFDGVHLKRYVPPLTGQEPTLPDTPKDIEDEIRKQESLLADLHGQISSGAASKKVEEQIWEQQRIVTQLKRKLRLVKTQSEGRLNLKDDKGQGEAGEGAQSATSKPKYEPIEYDEELNFSLQTPEKKPEKTFEDEVDNTKKKEDAKTTTDQSHKVTVQVHKQPEEVKKAEAKPKVVEEIKEQAKEPPPREEPINPQRPQPEQCEQQQPVRSEESPPKNVTVINVEEEQQKSSSNFPLLPPPPASTKIRSGNTHILRPTPASPRMPPKHEAAILKPDTTKSQSLPRGILPPSSSIEQELKERKRLEELELESLRVRFEFEELMALKSDLERRKRAERKEMDELRKELATMRTLYQYRATYSVDSSDSSGDENDDKVEDKDGDVEELSKTLSDLMRDNRELERQRGDLCKKIAEERAACVNLRVEIRLEQEKILMKKRKESESPELMTMS